MNSNKLNVCGLVGLCLEGLGILVLGLPCSIAGLILGIIGIQNKERERVLPILSIIFGAIELIIMIIYLSL